MCFDVDSYPPIRPVDGAAVDHRLITLTAADGNQFAAYEAFAREGTRAGVVVLPDVRGLYRFYEELAVRLAEAGYDAVAIDYYGRTAGIGRRAGDFPYGDHVPLTTIDGVRQDVAAAVTRLRDSGSGRIFTLGFCFGGSNAWQQAANHHGLAGAIGFYGRPDAVRPQRAQTPIDLAREMECPVLGLMGGDDPGIPPEVVAEFERALAAAGVEHEIITYPGAPHSFFDRKQEEFATESQDAWQRVLRFIAEH